MKRIGKAIMPLFLLLTACRFSLLPIVYYDIEFYDGKELLKKVSAEEGKEIVFKGEVPTKEGYVFIGWDIDGDGEADDLPKASENMDVHAIYKENRKYTVIFQDASGITCKEEQYRLKERIEPHEKQRKESDERYEYNFIGWDGNNDGIADSFPYTITGDVSFVPLYNKKSIEYHCRFYDGEELITSLNAKYKEKIVFPEPKKTLKNISGTYLLFIGWDGNDDDKPDDDLIVRCNKDFYAVYTDTQLLIMHIGDKVFVEQNKAGENLLLHQAEKADERYIWYTDENKTNELASDITMPEGNFVLYGESAPVYVIDTSLLDYKAKGIADKKEELLREIEYMYFNRLPEYTVELKYPDPKKKDINDALGSVQSECRYGSRELDYVFKSEGTGKKVSFKVSFHVTYDETCNTVPANPILIQCPALGLLPHPKTRSDEDFPIDRVSKTYEISKDSEQLFYCLEHGYRPIIRNEEIAKLYQRMKDVLREIIDDDMDDYTKALAVYQWLIMNVSYDKEVLDYVRSHPKENVSRYRCFGLEGVFIDKTAVCDGVSKAFASLCGIEGITCVRVSGMGKDNISHAWNKIRIDYDWYVIDATSGGVIADGEKELLTHNFFLITDQTMNEAYTENGEYFPGIKAEGKYNYYKTHEFEYEGEKHSFFCETIDDVVTLLKWFAENASEDMTCDCQIGFEGNVQEILKQANKKAKINFGHTVIERNGGDTLILIKQKKH